MKKIYIISIALSVFFHGSRLIAQNTMGADEYIEKAYQGDKESMFQLAMCYRRGWGVVEDQNKCVTWLKKASDANHRSARYYLAGYYETGNGGLEMDSLKAYHLYTQSAQQGDKYSMLELGENYIQFKQVNNALQDGIYWLRQISEGNYTNDNDNIGDDGMIKSFAEYYLYLLFQGNEGVERNIPLSIEFLMKSVNHGDDTSMQAQNAMGECLANGNGISKNKEEAIKWFEKSSQQGYGLAKGNLGAIYYGEGNYAKAIELLKAAATDDIYPSPRAMHLLYACYKYGRGVKTDAELCEHWLKEAINHKEKNAIELAKMYGY